MSSLGTCQRRYIGRYGTRKMIFIDQRVGSRELLGDFASLDIPAEILGEIDSDFQFSGHGPNGCVMIGFERKTVPDLVQSMREGRLAGIGGQIGKMLKSYDVIYLIIEGRYRRGDTGLVETPQGRDWAPMRGHVYISELLQFITSIRELAGLRIIETYDEKDTAFRIGQEYKWWNKPFESHDLYQTLYCNNPKPIRTGHKASLFQRVPQLVELWLAQLPGIDSKCFTLSPHFRNARTIANINEDQWMGLPGVGRKGASTIVREITKDYRP